MAIFIGNHQEGFDEIYLGNDIPTAIYLGNNLAWPVRVITIKLENARVVYSNGNYVHPSKSNYAQILADYNTYVNGRLDSTVVVQCTVSDLLPNVHPRLNDYIYMDWDNHNIYFDFDNYKDEEVSAQTVTITEASYQGYRWEGSITLRSVANVKSNLSQYTSFTPQALSGTTAEATTPYGDITSDGGDYYVTGYADKWSWTRWTSTYETPHSHTIVAATANTFEVSSAYSWITYINGGVYNPGTIRFSANGNTSNRTGSFTAKLYDSYTSSYVSGTMSIEQWRAPYHTYEYRILNFAIQPSAVTWNVYGYSNSAVITGRTQRSDTMWKDGQTIPGTWNDYNDTTNMVMLYGSDTSKFYLATYNGSSTGQAAINWQYPYNTGYAYAKIYANNRNTQDRDFEIEVRYQDDAISFAQKCQEPYINVSPKNISYEAGTYYMTVDANVDWTPSSNQSWVAVSKEGSQIKCVIAEEHTGATRTATITATGTGTHSSVSGSNTLTQEEGYYFEPQGDTGVTVSYAQTSFSIPFRSSRGGSPYQLTASSVSLSSNTMSAVLSEIRQVSGDMYIAQFTCQPNTSTTTEHTCTITIIQPRSRGDKSIVFNATQSIKEYITITDTYTTSGVSSTFYIPVSSNVDWTVSSNQSWCTVSNNNNTSVKVVVTENPSSSRQAIITLTGSGITARCTLTQTAAAITIYIKSNANTSSFAMYSGTGATGQALVSGSISQGQTKTYTVPKDSVVKSWMVTASGLTYCNFAGTPGTQVYTGVWQNTNTSITLTDGSTYSIN